MKKSWIVRMDEKAVSPVIATILMVAITVVLAAVLYVMVTGLIGGGGGTAPPAITFSADSPSTGVWEAEIQVSRASGWGSYRISLTNETVGAASGGVCGTGEVDLTDTLSIVCPGGGSAATLSYRDLASPASDQLNSGDKFRVTNVFGTNKYNVNIVWKVSGAIIKSVLLPPT